MKNFSQHAKDTTKKIAILFGRMNPPTKGHEENVEGLKSMASKIDADHLVIASHSVDAKKNPLSPDVKLKHLKRAFPNTNITTSSKDSPTIMHHAAQAYAKGYTHLTVVAGSDRVGEYKKLLTHYNGVQGRHGIYNFKKIDVKSTGERKQGISGTDMRNHAQNNDFPSFQKNLSSAMQQNVSHAKDLFKDVRKGMGLNEDTNRGLFKAIFLTGGPGSGKDVVIREAISEQKFVELNSVQAFDYLMDKQKLSEKSNDYRRESIRNRGPLIINGPADDHSKIIRIKEELEELGYETSMVFVDTTDTASKERNERLTKMIAESVRYDKWKLSQTCKESYRQIFENFIDFDNSGSYESLEEVISDTYEQINTFVENRNYNRIAFSWLETSGKVNITESVKSLFKENENVKKTSRFFENYKTRGTSRSGTTIKPAGGPKADNLGDIAADNRAADPNADNIKWDASKRRGGYNFRTYTEEVPSLKVFPEPKESNFSKDKEKIKKKGMVNSPTVNQRMRNITTIGPEFDTRAQGTVYAMSGLGDVTYREQFDFKGFRESYMDPSDFEMGVSGTAGNATNKEPMENPKDKLGYDYINKKKKKK
jgi:nicotinamide mononucleotide adenylyltransferase